MRIALLSPYSEISSIGVRSISAFLKQNGIHTRLVFLPLQKNFYSREAFLPYPLTAINNLADLVREDDLIGISLMSNYYDSIKELTVQLKGRLPGKPIVWGGIHPTIDPEECLAYADYVCIGEGEKPCLDLCQALSERRPAKHLPGMRCKADDVAVSTSGDCGTVRDLDTLPFPDYDLENDYILTSKKHFIPITRNNVERFLGATYWTIYTRGCPFSCTYCCNDALRRISKDLTRLRAKSPGYLVQELCTVKKNFPFIKYIYFTDDTLFALPVEAIREFALYYKKFVNLPFIVPGIHPGAFSEEKFHILVNGGMLRIRMGIQTGSTRVLDMYKRKQDNEGVIKISHSLQKYSKKLTMPNYDIILDNPWETTEDTLQTIDLLAHLASPFSLNIFSLTFFPGTSLLARARAEGRHDPGERLDNYLNYKPTYLNLIIALFGLFKVPKWLLGILLSARLINTKRNFVILHRLLYQLILIRRGACSIKTRDYSMFPPLLQLLLCRLFPPRA